MIISSSTTTGINNSSNLYRIHKLSLLSLQRHDQEDVNLTMKSTGALETGQTVVSANREVEWKESPRKGDRSGVSTGRYKVGEKRVNSGLGALPLGMGMNKVSVQPAPPCKGSYSARLATKMSTPVVNACQETPYPRL